MDDHVRALSRVYGPETWELYAALDQSIEPRGPDVVHAWAAEHLARESVILDAGCRDAAHLIRLVQATGATGVGVDPVGRLRHHTRSKWSSAYGRFMLVFTVFATDRLEPKEAALLARSLAVVAANLVEATVENAFARARLEVVRTDVIGTEWREYAEERSRLVSRDLLRLARLRRQRDRIVEATGQDIYDHVEANLHLARLPVPGQAPADAVRPSQGLSRPLC